MSDFPFQPALFLPPPIILTWYSEEGLGIPIGRFNAGAGASTAWPVANRGIFLPFVLSSPYTVKTFVWLNGATLSGNVAAAIYNTDGSRLVGTGSKVQAGVSILQTATGVETTLGSGNYYMGLSLDNTTGRISRLALTIDDRIFMGLRVAESTFPLTATGVTFVASGLYLPTFGISSSTVI